MDRGSLSYRSPAKMVWLTVLSVLAVSVHSVAQTNLKKLDVFLEDNCIRCHGPDRERGGLRIDTLSKSLDDHESLEHFQNMLDEMAVGAMPPEDEPQPKPAVMLAATNLIQEHLKAARAKHTSGGGKPVRRLTRQEYTNTITDLLGIHIPTNDLPVDGSPGNFDTDAGGLYTTDLHLESYLDVARTSVEKFIASRNTTPGKRSVDLPLLGDIKKSEYAFSAEAVPPAGYLIVEVPFWQRNPKSSNKLFVGPATNSAEEHRVTGTAAKPTIVKSTYFSPSKSVKWALVESNVPNEQVIKGKPSKGQTKAINSFKVNAASFVKAQDLTVKKPVIMGPAKGYQIISPQPYQFFKPLLKKYGETPPDSSSSATIKAFIRLVNRGRTPDREFVNRLNKVFELGRKDGMDFWEAIVEPLALSMCSIETMFHFEDHGSSATANQVSGVELANRISYFLWRSAPDSRLLAAGLSGDLLDPKVRTEHIYRMFKDERFNRFLEDFSNQWLELEKQNLIAVDNRLHNFKDSLKESLKKETIEFLNVLVRKNLPIKNMIDSDFLVINNEMAEHYGIPGVEGHEFRPVRKPKSESFRGGILTQAGILMQTGNGERSSVVERGVFVLRKILGDEPPPPPPNVDQLPTDGNGFLKLTAAELVKLHANTTQCASCHGKIDPLGVGLEEFDAVGRFRSAETRINPNYTPPKKGKKGKGKLTFDVKLETRGRLPNGKRYEGITGLKKALLPYHKDLARSFVEALLTYGNGRKAGVADQAIVDNILKRAASTEYPAASMIVAVLQSKALTSK